MENNNVREKSDNDNDDNKVEDDELVRTKYFIRDNFLQICQEEPKHRQVCIPFFTSALSKESIQSFLENFHQRISAIYCFHVCPLCT